MKRLLSLGPPRQHCCSPPAYLLSLIPRCAASRLPNSLQILFTDLRVLPGGSFLQIPENAASPSHPNATQRRRVETMRLRSSCTLHRPHQCCHDITWEKCFKCACAQLPPTPKKTQKQNREACGGKTARSSEELEMSCHSAQVCR